MRIIAQSVNSHVGSGYPLPFRLAAAARHKRALGDAAGLTQFGVNLTRLPPGGWSSQRHWHSHEDEFVYMLEGELMLITDAGEERVGPGDCAGFRAGVAEGHHLVNRGAVDAVYLEVGTRSDQDIPVYPDVDLALDRAKGWMHKDGTQYPPGT